MIPKKTKDQKKLQPEPKAKKSISGVSKAGAKIKAIPNPKTKLQKLKDKSPKPEVGLSITTASGLVTPAPEPKRSLIKHRHKDSAGRFIHQLLGIALPISVFVFIGIFRLPWIALILVLLSKWQIFVIKPRFWWANFKFSAVDITLKLSVLLLVLLAEMKIDDLVLTNTLPLRIFQLSLVSLYIFWNLWLKKLNSPKGMLAQALTAQFIGIIAISWLGGFVASPVPLAITLSLSWIITYASAQHMLYAYEESAIPQLASFWALTMTTLVFLESLWGQNFTLIKGLIYLPVMSIIITLLSILFANTHNFVEDSQSPEDVSKAQLQKNKVRLVQESVLAIGFITLVSIFIALI